MISEKSKSSEIYRQPPLLRRSLHRTNVVPSTIRNTSLEEAYRGAEATGEILAKKQDFASGSGATVAGKKNRLFLSFLCPCLFTYSRLKARKLIV
jgi:hypothetical protein